MRPIPNKPDSLKFAVPATARQASYPLKLITPMFGGGYEARKIDPLNPIRSAAVRGHLRQWWRTIVGARYRTPADLYKAEQEIWGSAQQPGRVAVRVEISPDELHAIPNRLVQADIKTYPPTAMFGLAKDNQNPAAVGLNELVFTVHLSQSPTRKPLTDEEWIEVQQAISAWIQFGGVGARTRRGCGSIGLTEKQNLLELPLEAKGERHNSPLTLLAQRRCYTKNSTRNAETAWRDAVDVIAEFRQGENVGRNPGTGKKLGRSRWPEPNTLRHLISAQRDWTHKPVPPYGFPRAEFGLPIVFQFYPDRTKGEIEPNTVILQGTETGHLRFASPIIIKAMQVAPNQYVSLILFLDSPSVFYHEKATPSGKLLSFSGEEPSLRNKNIVNADHVTMPPSEPKDPAILTGRDAVKPLAGLLPRDAFEAFIQTRGFKL